MEFISKSKIFGYYEKYMMVIGILGQLMFYAQGIKIFTAKSAHDVSLLGFLLGLASVTSWLIYGILIRNKILVLANILAVIGALFVVVGTFIYG